jgi:hypothetical protein
VITGWCLRATIISRDEGEFQYTTHDYMSFGSTLATPSPAEMLAFSTAFQAIMLTNYLACLTADSKLDEILITDLSVGTVPSLHDRTNTGTAGSVADHALPFEMAVVLSKRTALRGQHGFGRIAMPCIPSTFVDLATHSNELNATGLGTYSNLADSMEQNITHGAITYEPVVTTRPIAPATLVTHAAKVTSVLLRTPLGTCRRRKPGRGI